MYCLLPNATTETYDKVFNYLVDITGPNDKTFILDMEMAAKNSISNRFSNPRISFCYYHFCQAHWRKIQELGHQVQYGNEPDLARKFRLFSSLAFLPTDLVPNAFDMLFEKFTGNDQLEDFLTYFESNFIGRPLRNNQRGNPRYSLDSWNQHTNITNDINRTNNRVEGWNRRIAEIGDCSHPHIFKFVSILKKDMVNTNQILVEANSGQQPEPQRITYRNITERLKNISSTSNFAAMSENDDLLYEYLNNIAMIIKY